MHRDCAKKPLKTLYQLANHIATRKKKTHSGHLSNHKQCAKNPLRSTPCIVVAVLSQAALPFSSENAEIKYKSTKKKKWNGYRSHSFLLNTMILSLSDVLIITVSNKCFSILDNDTCWSGKQGCLWCDGRWQWECFSDGAGLCWNKRLSLFADRYTVSVCATDLWTALFYRSFFITDPVHLRFQDVWKALINCIVHYFNRQTVFCIIFMKIKYLQTNINKYYIYI